MPAPQIHVPLDEIDPSSVAFWTASNDYRDAAFRTLRNEDPIRFFAEPIPLDNAFEQGPGYFALTRYDDVWFASRNPQLFCSGKGSNIGDLPEFMLETLGSMINMDDPRHARLRRIVSRGFTPRVIHRVETDVALAAQRIVDAVIDKGECDFVSEIAAALPLKIICDMAAIPESSWSRDEGRWGGALWQAVKSFPVIGGRSTLVVAAAGLGTLLLSALWIRAAEVRRGRQATIVIMTLLALFVVQVGNSQVWERYFDPAILVALAWLTALGIDRTRPHSAGRAVLGAGLLALAQLGISALNYWAPAFGMIAAQ